MFPSVVTCGVETRNTARILKKSHMSQVYTDKHTQSEKIIARPEISPIVKAHTCLQKRVPFFSLFTSYARDRWFGSWGQSGNQGRLMKAEWNCGTHDRMVVRKCSGNQKIETKTAHRSREGLLVRTSLPSLQRLLRISASVTSSQ